MKTKVMTLAAVVAVPVLASLLVFADDDWEASRNTPGVEPVTNVDYQNECGACHFAYQPGLLPARSWQALMTGLDQHFTEAKMLTRIDTYLAMVGPDANADIKRWIPDGRTYAEYVEELREFVRQRRAFIASELAN